MNISLPNGLTFFDSAIKTLFSIFMNFSFMRHLKKGSKISFNDLTSQNQRKDRCF